MLVKCPSPAILALFTNLELCNRQNYTHTNLEKIKHKIDVYGKELCSFLLSVYNILATPMP